MVDHQSPEQRAEQAQEEWYESTRYQILLFVVGIAIFGLVLGFVPNWYIAPETSTQKKDLVQALEATPTLRHTLQGTRGCLHYQ
jgi:hypothetical protein